MMKLLSVNLSSEKAAPTRVKGKPTGIYKEPLQHPVHISNLGLVGDFIANTRHHGGPDQAVYIYGAADYSWWEHQLGRPLLPGTFGENLTISDLESASFSIGDRLQVGTVVLEVTSPRIPCDTFAARMGDPGFVGRFRAAERPGLYCRVIQEGTIQAGDLVSILPFMGERVALLVLFRDFYDHSVDPLELARMLNAPISMRARASLEERMRKIRSTT